MRSLLLIVFIFATTVEARSPRTRKRECLLEMYPGASAAYSLRPISRWGFFNDIVTVRRSSDNAESGFLWWEIAGSVATTWTGANDGFVKTWFDQSGNGLNATQTVLGDQPKLVLSGVLNVQDEKPAIKFGTGVSNTPLEYTLSGARPFTDFIVAKRLVTGVTDYLRDTTERNVIGENQNFGLGTFNGIWLRQLGFNTTSQQLIYSYSNSTSSLFAVNGGTAASGDSGLFSFGGTVFIGKSFYGHMFEMITYLSDQTANRAVFEANINDHYGIY